MNRRSIQARRSSAAHGSRGFTLLEVLIAILVLSIGVLGMAGMQAMSLQSNKEARYQSSAVRLARELGDLMRGNKDIAIQATAGSNPYLVDFTGTLPSTTADCFVGACASTTAVAQFQIREWLARVAAELPGARVTVCFDAQPYVPATGEPRWACTDSGGTAVVKIGWTRAGFDRAAFDVASRPSVVLPVIAGSVE